MLGPFLLSPFTPRQFYRCVCVVEDTPKHFKMLLLINKPKWLAGFVSHSLGDQVKLLICQTFGGAPTVCQALYWAQGIATIDVFLP